MTMTKLTEAQIEEFESIYSNLSDDDDATFRLGTILDRAGNDYSLNEGDMKFLKGLK